MQKRYLLIFSTLLASCSSKPVLIGQLNMISNRNVESSAPYTLLRSYAGSETSKSLRKSKAKNVGEAVTNVVRDVPGGEFLKNAKMYRIGSYYAVEGDVWGLTNQNQMRGFRTGDRVTWRGYLKPSFKVRDLQGEIIELRSNRLCVVKERETGKIVEVDYEELVKLNN